MARYFYARPEDRYLESLNRGIAGAIGVSGGSAHAIPALLLPNLIGGRKPTDITNPIREVDEHFDGYDCFVVSGGTTLSSRKVWVSKHDFLVRKIEIYSNQQIESRRTIEFYPTINVSIDQEFLEFDAPDP
ncbi:MAG: hypothetical protein H7A04_15860 [Pseudomonadales bacterium]|nr:hypothetical protein [Pseudomonadales bacterium]